MSKTEEAEITLLRAKQFNGVNPASNPSVVLSSSKASPVTESPKIPD